MTDYLCPMVKTGQKVADNLWPQITHEKQNRPSVATDHKVATYDDNV